MEDILTSKRWRILGVFFLLSGCHLEVSEEIAEPATRAESTNLESGTPQVSAEQILPSVPEPREDYYHEVRAGETLSRIAKQYDSSAEELAKVNGLGAPDRLEPGQLIYIPENLEKSSTSHQEKSP